MILRDALMVLDELLGAEPCDLAGVRIIHYAPMWLKGLTSSMRS